MTKALREVAIIGSNGMLAAELRPLLEAEGCRVSVGDLPETDITNEHAVQTFLGRVRPQAVFNCAAMTDVDGCETRHDEAFAVNARGAGNVAAATAAIGARLVHISTDFVFDGRKGSAYVEEDTPAPLSVYGKSKLAGEEEVRRRGGRWVIARTAWLYGRARMNFVDRILEVGREQQEVAVVTDQVGSPTWARDLAAALIVLAQHGAEGVFHVVNRGACSRFDQARVIFDCAGCRARLRPAITADFPRAARVPAFSALCVDKLERVTGHRMRLWDEALCEYVRSESATTRFR